MHLYFQFGAKVRGGRSDFVQEIDAAMILEIFLRAEFKTVRNAGHWIHIDDADEFHSIVTDFLAAHSRSYFRSAPNRFFDINAADLPASGHRPPVDGPVDVRSRIVV